MSARVWWSSTNRSGLRLALLSSGFLVCACFSESPAPAGDDDGSTTATTTDDGETTDDPDTTSADATTMEPTGAPSDWLDPAYARRRPIRVHPPVALEDFPLGVVLSADADLVDFARPDGTDIAFTAADGTTVLDHEREQYDGGDLVAWVRVPDVAANANETITGLRRRRRPDGAVEPSRPRRRP